MKILIKEKMIKIIITRENKENYLKGKILDATNKDNNDKNEGRKINNNNDNNNINC